jgi:hypothetical protein
MRKFFRNIRFLFQLDLDAVSKEVDDLGWYRSQVVDAKEAIVKYKMLKRYQETKDDREENFEKKADIIAKLNRWANESDPSEENGEKAYKMYEILRRFVDKIPDAKPSQEPDLVYDFNVENNSGIGHTRHGVKA